MNTILLMLACLIPQESGEFIDRAVEGSRQDEKPASRCSDETFLRRATLDLIGRAPSVDEVRAFVADPDRARQVDVLIDSEEFDDWWARFLLETTTERRAAQYEEHNGRRLHDWLRNGLRNRRAYSGIVADLLLAQGTHESAPETNFLLRYGVRPPDLTGAIGRAFLGRKLQCAQCHDHPFDSLSQEDFWGIAAFFSRTRRYYVEDGSVSGVTDVRRGTMEMPPDGDPGKPGVAVRPRWIGATEGREKAARSDLVRAVVADPLFAKNLVNRVWARLMGRGFVEPLDGLGPNARPVHSALFDELASRFVSSGHDLRALVRWIVSSRAYQRSARPGAEPFADARLRPLTVDQLWRSLVRATGYGVDPSLEAAAAVEEATEEQEAALDYQDRIAEDLFPGGARSVRRSLALLNRGEIHAMVDAGVNLLLAAHGEEIRREHFETLFLSLLSRKPTQSEWRSFEGRSERSDLEDVFWAVINSVEFQTIH